MKSNRALFLVMASSLLVLGPARAAAADAKPADAKPAASAGTAASKATTDASGGSSLFQTSNYKLRPTELISVNVVDDPKANGDFRIGIDGNVQLPYIQDHPVKVAGLSASDAARTITQAYKDLGIFINPSITVSVKEYVAQQVYFMGEVNKPGTIPIPTGQKLTLVQALNVAGGQTHNATRLVTITRIKPDGNTETLKDVDLWGAVHGKVPDVTLQEGDTIFLGQSLLGDAWQN